jgi:NAD(P)H-dependent flavin oxidoreductase YrpB (nitropropane dioxygenase family)
LLSTAFTELVGCSAPIQLAGMPGITTPALVAAVADAGGLAMLGATAMAPAFLDATLAQLAQRTAGAVGASFLAPFLDPESLDVAARRAKVVEVFYGDPDAALVARARAHGALACWQVGSAGEAEAAERAGCDFVVVQGSEAGGHVRGTTSLLPLLSRVLDRARVPVVAAGGIATPRDLAAVLACGAAGARIGTRFVAAAESGAHPAYVQALLAASAEDTCLTEAFSADWPDAPHRVLRSAVARARELADDVVGETHADGQVFPMQRFAVFPPTTSTTGRIEAMALYAGESVGSVAAIQPAAEIVAELVAGAEQLLRGAAR